ncbi:MAG: B12-binding domain-containing radical SAM protein [Candidatus Omnitrophica bacterium]|nr:B12-binding domain-containing radical SAM protein [Candidatus Omnitrophota bacterium]
MKLLLINPLFPDSLWSFRGIKHLTPAHAHAPLGLCTVAGLTPPDIDVEILDENVEPIDFGRSCDMVAMTAFNVQVPRALEIAAEFRKRGKMVIFGGPYASLIGEKFLPYFDVVFKGETEYTWPQFIQEFKQGTHKRLYIQKENIDISTSPTPRYDLLKADRYACFYLQTTRGCPFKCEFCDIIVSDGRVPRAKPVNQIMKEVAVLHRIGANNVTFSDANFIGNPISAKKILEELVAWGKEHNFPIRWNCELTINVAERDDLLELARTANFGGMFFGIETPRKSSLTETQKTVNLKRSLVESVRKVQSYNIATWSGMIVGFDHDDIGIFQEQFDFLQEAAIPFTTAGILVAIPLTPLYERLEREGRLSMDISRMIEDSEKWRGHGSGDLNFVPKLMTQEEIKKGYNWLIRAMYSYEAFGERLLKCFSNFQVYPPLRRKDPNEKFNAAAFLKGIMLFARILKHFTVTSDKHRRAMFKKVMKAWWQNRKVWALEHIISCLTLHIHFHYYVNASQGNPDTAGCASPFDGITPLPHIAACEPALIAVRNS